RLEPGHPVLDEPAPARGHIDVARSDDECDDPFTQPVVGPTHHDRLLDAGMQLEGPLDLRRRDVFTAPDDQLLEPPGDGQPTLVIHHAEIAAAEPTPVHGRRRLLGVGIPGEEFGSAYPYLALMPGRAPPPV